MSPKVSDKYRNEKIQSILETSKEVFIRKGFYDTTMKDIVDACNISRGGLYLYFSSTEEIFKAILDTDLQEDENTVILLIEKGLKAHEILKSFIDSEGENIKNIRNTIIPTAYEYFIKNVRKGEASSYLKKRHEAALKVLNRVVDYGIHKGEISKRTDPTAISNCILTFMEGLIITAIASVLDEKTLKIQLDFFNEMLFSIFFSI